MNDNVGKKVAQLSVTKISYPNRHSNFPDDPTVNFSAAFPSNRKGLFRDALHSPTMSAALNSSISEPLAKYTFIIQLVVHLQMAVTSFQSIALELQLHWVMLKSMKRVPRHRINQLSKYLLK